MSRPQPLAFQPSAAQQEAAREHAKLLESLDLTRQHRPFRNPAWKPSARRNKNLKQILSEGNRKDAASAAQRAQRQQMQEQQQQQEQEQDQAQKARSGPGAVTYTNVESAPSLSASTAASRMHSLALIA
ncbi:hypothetical protein KEM55_003898 [Ascosphaera atra]|nr:hypothetical protein KEM55_003898 [Ascosphaera atra]